MMRARPFLALALCLSLSSCAGLWNQLFPDDDPKPVTQAKPGLKKRILVVRFLNKTPFGGELLPTGAEQIVAEAFRSLPDCTIVDESEIEGHEGFRAQDAYFNYRTIFAKARAYGIAGVVLGSVEDLAIHEEGDEIGIFRTRYFKARATVHLSIYDAASERELVDRVVVGNVEEERTRIPGERAPGSEDAERGEAAVAKALEPLLPQFPDFARRIGWWGRIAKIDLHRYYINAGEETGLTLGALLKVFGDGQAITDPQTGATLGVSPGRFKGLLKVVDYLGKDGAVAVVQSGGGFREQDHVAVYSPPPR